MKKNIFILLVLLLSAVLHALGQQVEVITDNVEKPAFENKSYLVVKSLKLTAGFQVSGATHGTWYAKAHPNATPHSSPSPEHNFVKTESIYIPGVSTEAGVRNLTMADKATGFTYTDGVGKRLQQIMVSGSRSLQDLVRFSYYDALGRPTRQYLPYSSGSSGAFRAAAISEQASFYSNVSDKIADDTRPYGEVIFDDSPLSRITQTKAEGSAWSARATTTNFKIYDASSPVRIWDIVSGLPNSTSTYPGGTLTINEVINEEGSTAREYRDFLGRTIMKEAQTTNGSWAKTYYVYNLNNNLVFIIPPAAIGSLTPDQTFADRWYFQYEYDEYQRQVGRKSPGAGWVYTIYDRWDRPVLTQDANQRAKATPEWSFVKYDDLNRPVVSGVYATSTARNTLASNVAGSTGRYETRNSSAVGYTLNQTFPTTVTESDVYTISYFDDYAFTTNPGWDAEGNSYSFVSETGYTGSVFLNSSNAIYEMSTGGKVRILNTTEWLNSVTYYDNRYRPIQTISENHFHKTDRITIEYDFSGKVFKTKRVHNNALSQIVTIQERFTYDISGRLLNAYHQINSQPEVLLSSLEYNELGEVVDRKIHSENNGSDWLQSVDFRYNIRGWNTHVNNVTPDSGDPVDYFGLELGFNNALSGNTVRYDGLISGVRSKHDLSPKARIFNYTYDKGSLAASSYKVDNGAIPQNGIFNETISYDINGNILSLNRNGGLQTSTPIDQLTYTYGNGNQLTRVTDALLNENGFDDGYTSGDDYTYDPNGNVTRDRNKGIRTSADGVGIIYNMLNLQERINFVDGTYILYQYDATGTKLSETFYNSSNVAQPGKIEYAGEFIYVDGQPQSIFHSQGRLINASYANLITNVVTREANSLEGFTASGSVSLTHVSGGGPAQSYLKAVCNQTGSTPGVFPIGGTFTVQPGENYSFKVLGYQSVGTNAHLYVWGNNGDIVWPGAPLPSGASNEDWATSSFTVPAGVTQIKFGVLWNNGASGNTLYINRVALYMTDWEYQYYMSDHLGSPRVVLQTQPHTRTYTATMESQSFEQESAYFLNMNSANEVILSAANATPGGTRAYVLNSSYHVGPARSFKVLPGDVIDASVMAYYGAGGTYSKTSLTAMGAYVAAALAGGTGGLVDGINTSYSNSTGANPLFLLSQDQGSGKPSAYLNYILFDETYTPIEAKSTPVGGTAGVLHMLVLPTITISQTGYLYVYLTYDNDSGADVYFDELKITYRESPVVQINTYYAYGLPGEIWLRDGEVDTREKYQGKEYSERTSWYDFHARQYDPATGRWFAVDPAGQFASPYSAMANSPVMTIDPDGKVVWFVPVIIGAVAGAYGGGVVANNGQMNPGKWDYSSGKTWRDMGYGALVGATSGGIAGTIAASGAPFANTFGAMAGSFVNSIGTVMYNDGQTDFTISFGVASYNFDQNDWGYLGGKGNGLLETLGYSLGAFALASDINAFAQGAYSSADRVKLKTDWHSEFEDLDNKQIFSYGALNDDGTKIITTPQHEHLDLIPKKFSYDITNYQNSTSDGAFARKVLINRLNMDKFYQYKNSIKSFSGESYRFASVFPRLQNSMHCTIAASRALLKAGVFNVPVLRMPWFLDLQMRIRDYTHMSYTLTR